MKRRINDIIEYFQNERKLEEDRYLKSDNHQKYTLTNGINLFALLAVIIVAFFDKFILIKEVSNYIMYMLTVIFMVIIFNIFHFVYLSWKNDKKYHEKIIRFDIIIDFLWHFKIADSAADLSPLINRLKLDTRGYRHHSRENEIQRLDEIINAIDLINNKLIQDEK